MPTRRITLVADELLGHTRTGGIGTATTHLALALGRMGHRVELLYVGEPPSAPMADDWARLYDDAGVDVRLLPRSGETVEPPFFSRMHDVELALAAEPPDVVIVQDLAAPAYTALRLRQLGLAFAGTLFVVYCHGGRRWITDMARKVRVLPGAHAITLLEQASVELADVAVSPSAYLLDWMRGQGWRLPATSLVIPYLTRAAATGEAPPAHAANGGERVERIAFFGRLEERKGLRPFAAGLNALAPNLLEALELEFVGAPTPAWPPERVEALLSERTRKALRRISFATDLDQPDALARLSRPGTLAVVPSFGETFSNAVYECLEHGIPFLASDAGAPRELIAADDASRVLFEPTAEGVAGALRRALADTDALRPPRPAFDPAVAYERWADVVARRPEQRKRAPHVEGEWILAVDDGDVPDDELRTTLAQAQAASGADVVTCGVRLPSGAQRYFLGDPGGLGLIENHYGTTALVRRSLVDGERAPGGWRALARLVLDGATIVSVPRALVTRARGLEGDPADELAVLHEFERRLPRAVRSLARIAAGLAAPEPTTHRRRSIRRLWRR